MLVPSDASMKAVVQSLRDIQRIFTANHYSVRASSLSQFDAQPHNASHDLHTLIPLSNNLEIISLLCRSISR